LAVRSQVVRSERLVIAATDQRELPRWRAWLPGSPVVYL